MNIDKGAVCPEENTQFLIERFKVHFKDLISKKISTKLELWKIISKEFEEEKGINITPKQCQLRWKSILRYYRRYVYQGIKKAIIAPFIEDLSVILTNPHLGYNISIDDKNLSKNRKSHETDDEDDTVNDDDDDDNDEDYVGDDDKDDSDNDSDEKNVKRRKSPRTMKSETNEFVMEFENVFPEPFVETTSAENYINMNFVNTNTKGTEQAAAITAKPINTTNNFISNDNNNKNTNTSESFPLATKIAIENLKNSKETTMILKKLTIEILKNSKRKSIIHQKKLQLMAERNRILKSIKLSEPESSVSVSNVNAAINNQQEFYSDDIEYTGTINEESDKSQVQQWLTYNNFNSYNKVFQFFQGTDILKLNKDDLIKICGVSDGIRMYNLLHIKKFESNLKLYISLNGGQHYNIINLIEITIKEFLLKLIKIKEFNGIVTRLYSHVNTEQLMNILNSYVDDNSIPELGLSFYLYGPNNIQIILTKDVLANIKNDSSFIMEFHTDGKIFLRASPQNE